MTKTEATGSLLGTGITDGVLPVDKPAGPTSHDVVARARLALGQRRIGHTGTLDPFASGLLLLCVGRATRIAEYLTRLSKQYRAVMTLGTGTGTDDATGAVTTISGAWRDLTAEQVAGALTDQIGTLLQRPPAYSAKKVAGERMYDLARKGLAPVPEPVSVEIHSLDIVDWAPPALTFDVVCSAGTYVRAIARDAGDRLGVPAHLSALRRTAIGSYRAEDAVSVECLDDAAVVQRAWITPLQALAHLPVFEIDAVSADALAHGRSIEVAETRAARGTTERVSTGDTPERVAASRTPDSDARVGKRAGAAVAALGDRVIAIVESDGHVLRPRKVFA
ncbi:MAG: tRNA pseudouridine(55) synthase TruB [Longimicrobiales bacterium]